MRRNIYIAYALSFLKHTWFWLGIWVFYYLRFTDYAGIGLLETVLILTMTVAEIPTGALADLLGKKPTLILSFFLLSAGNILMATAPNFPILAWSVFIGSLGVSLYSGTMDALVYDSLKQEGKSETYDKVISNINTVLLISPALCGALGGFLYRVSPGLPFIASGTALFFGFVLAWFLVEPRVDTEKFSFRAFMNQTKAGIKELTKNAAVTSQTILLLSVGVIVVIADEMINGFLGVEFGFTGEQMGILWAIIYLMSAAASQTVSILRLKIGDTRAIVCIGFAMAGTFLISPVAGLIVGGISLLLRSGLQAVFTNLASIVINANTESRYRATTLSTFAMMKNIPYVVCASIIGTLSDIYSAKTIAAVLGIIVICLVSIQHAMSKSETRLS